MLDKNKTLNVLIAGIKELDWLIIGLDGTNDKRKKHIV